MKLVDFFPARGTFRPGETVELWADLDGATRPGSQLEVTIWHLSGLQDQLSIPLPTAAESSRFPIHWRPSAGAGRGYGVEIELSRPDGSPVDRRTTAFDVLESWTASPRCGFLSDFHPGREDLEEVFDELLRFHINGLQFYDWQYRHDRLVPEAHMYDDPLGRKLSRGTLQECLARARATGMATMAYAAVYAASAEHWHAHPEAALYDKSGKPVPFGETFLGLMDPTPGSAWAGHLHSELDRVLNELEFDGIHLDQYGEPRAGYNAQGGPVDLPAAFVEFIAGLRERHPEAPLAFNAVAGWPLDQLAQAPLDFLYVEIWPPMVDYEEVIRLLQRARSAAPDKAVVVACYLPPDSAANLLILDALAFSLGGSRIEIGEAGRLLSDPYFPKHEALPPELKARMRAYYDFAVRCGELLGPAAANLNHLRVSVPAGVWAFPRRAHGWLAISLVNLSGIDEPRWDRRHDPPRAIEPLTLDVAPFDARVKAVWWASPDRGEPALSPAEWELDGDRLRITVPHLDTWSLIALELDGGAPPA